MANKSIASVAVELDAAQTGKSFNQLYSIVYDRLKNLPDAYIHLDEKETRKSFSKLQSIVDSEIQKVQKSISAVGNITFDNLDINKTLTDISSNIDSIKNKLEQLSGSALEPLIAKLSYASSNSIDGVVNRLEDLKAVLTEINSKNFGNVTQILSNGLSPETAKDNALRRYRDDAIAFATELQNLAPKLAAIINSGMFKGTSTQSMLTQSMMGLFKFDTQSWARSVSMSGVEKVTQRLTEFLPMIEQFNAAVDQMGDAASANGLVKLKLPEYILEEAEDANNEASDLFATLNNIAAKLDEINETVKNIFSFADSVPDYSNIEGIVENIKLYFEDMVKDINESISSIGSVLTGGAGGGRANPKNLISTTATRDTKGTTTGKNVYDIGNGGRFTTFHSEDADGNSYDKETVTKRYDAEAKAIVAAQKIVAKAEADAYQQSEKFANNAEKNLANIQTQINKIDHVLENAQGAGIEESDALNSLGSVREEYQQLYDVIDNGGVVDKLSDKMGTLSAKTNAVAGDIAKQIRVAKDIAKEAEDIAKAEEQAEKEKARLRKENEKEAERIFNEEEKKKLDAEKADEARRNKEAKDAKAGDEILRKDLERLLEDSRKESDSIAIRQAELDAAKELKKITEEQAAVEQEIINNKQEILDKTNADISAYKDAGEYVEKIAKAEAARAESYNKKYEITKRQEKADYNAIDEKAFERSSASLIDKAAKLSKKIQSEMAYINSMPGGLVSEEYKDLNAYSEKVSDIIAKLENADFGSDINLKEISDELKTISNGYEDAADSYSRYIESVKKNDAENKKSASDMDKRNSALKQYETLLGHIQKSLRDYTAAENGMAADSYASIKSNENALIDLKRNFDAGNISLEEFSSAMKTVAVSTATADREIKNAGEDGNKTGNILSSIGAKLATIFSFTRLASYVDDAVRQMLNAAIEIDTAMTQLQIVTGATDTQMKEFADTSVAMAKSLGKSVTDVVNSIEVFSRLGYSLGDASELSKYATILSNVASVDLDSATTGLTSIIKGYGMEVSETEHVADVLIEVGQKYAVSANEMLDAYERSSAALSATGVSFEKSAGLIAAANAAIQNASTVGTALKTVSARIRGSKSDLEELGENAEELADGLSKYRDELKALTGFDIMIDDKSFKDMYDIFEGISRVWEDLTDTQQARVSEILGGTRQLQVISSIINNWSDAAGAYSSAMNSAGVSAKANAKYMETAQAHIDQFKATLQELGTDLMDSDIIKFIVDRGRGILQLVDGIVKILDKIGGLRALFLGAGVFKGTSKITSFFDKISEALKKNSVFMDAFTLAMTDGATKARAAFTGLGAALSDGKLLSVPGKFKLILTGIAAAIGIITKLYNNYKESHPSFEELKTSAEETESELDGLKGKLEENIKKINELAALKDAGTISFIQEEELSNLEKENKELERNVDLKETSLKLANDELKDKARSEYWNYNEETSHFEFGTWANSKVDKYTGVSFKNRQEELSFIEERYSLLTRGYDALETAYEEAEEKYKKAVADGDKKEEEHWRKRKAALSESLLNTKVELGEIEGTLEKQRDTFIEYRNALDSEEDKEAYDFFNKAVIDIEKLILGEQYFYKKGNELVSGMSKEAKVDIEELVSAGALTEENLVALAEKSEEIKKVIETLQNEYGFSISEIIANFLFGGAGSNVSVEADSSISDIEKLEKALESLSKEKDALNNAFSEQNETGSLTVKTYKDLIAISPDYASCLEYENGMIVLNTESARALYETNAQLAKSQAEIVKSAAKLKYKKNAEEIRKLSISTEDLIENEERLNELYSEQHLLSGQITEAELLVSELNSAANAYNRFKDLFDGAKTGTENYEDFLGVLKEVKDFIDNDMLGSGNEKLSEFLKFALPENWAGGIEDYYKKVLSRYFTENNEGYKNFVADAKKAGLVTEENGQIIIDNTKTWEDWTNQMQMTSDVLDTFIRYSSVFKGTDLSNWAAWDEHNQIDTAIQQELETIKSLSSLDEQIEKARAALREANAEGNEDAAGAWAKFISAKLEEQRLLGEDLDVDLSEVGDDLQKIYDTIIANQENAFIGDLGAQEATTALGETYNKLSDLLDLVQKAKDTGDLSSIGSILTLKEPEEGTGGEDVTKGLGIPRGRDYIYGAYKAERIGEGLGIGPVGDPDSLAGRFSETADEVNIDVNSMISDIESLRDELISLGEEYNSLVNGNVDYNKRPILSAMDMIKAGWDIAEEDMDHIFTTYSSGFDNVGNFSVEVTPILENGEVLSPDELRDYVSKLVGNGSMQDLLDSDYLHIVMNVDANPEWNEQYWDEFQNKVGDVKAEHAELIEMLLEEQGIIMQGGQFVITTNADETVEELDEVSNYKIKDKSFTIKAFVQSIGDTVNSITGKVKSFFGADASGTLNAVGGKTLVNELGPELISANGKAYIANGGEPAVVDLPAGAIVLDADETKRALGYSKIGRSINALASGNTPRTISDNAAASWMCPACKTINTNRNTCRKCGLKRSYALNYTPPSLAHPDDINIGTGSGSGGGGGGGSSSGKKEESWFEKQLKYHQHLLAMDQESLEDYLKWLDAAYKKAYKEGIIELDDYYKYAEEIREKLRDLFRDYLNDQEFSISQIAHEDENNIADQIAIYEQLLVDVRNQINQAYADGLDDNNEYIQELWEQWWEYYDNIQDLRDSTEENARDALDELVQYRIRMLRQQLEDEKESYRDRLDTLRDFIDKQKEMLRDSADEEDYLKEQQEKRKKIADIEAQLAQLEFDGSAWAQKRKLELQEELASAREDLYTFERDHAIQSTEEELDNIYELTEESVNNQTDLLEERLNNASALYEQALDDVRNNSQDLYDEMVAYELQYGSGLADGLREIWENAYVALEQYMDLFDEYYQDVALGNYTDYTQDVVDTSIPAGATPGYTAPISTPSASSPSSTSTPTAPSLTTGSYVDVKEGTKWYSDSAGGGDYGVAHGGTIKYINEGASHPYNIDGLGWIRRQDIVGYMHGTSNATPGLHSFDEDGSEYIFTSSDGNKYKLFNSGDKVLNSKASQFLYDFANKGASVFNNLTKGLSNMFGSIGSLSPVQISMGNIIVNGNADDRTVSEIRRAQRENVDYMLREFRRLKA